MHHEQIALGNDAHLNELTANQNVIVKGTPTVHDGKIVVLYEMAQEMVVTESEHIARLIPLAKVIKQDENYQQLKNVKQRTIYILTRYGIPSIDAEDVIALMDPAMECVLDGHK